MTYRAISEAEIPIVADIQARAFRNPAERYLEAYRGDGRLDWRALRLFENDGGEAVAALNVFYRSMSFNAGELDAGLIATVGVPPEERRRGYARGIMTGLLEELWARQAPVSLLYPFSVAFYRSLGYGVANFTWFLKLPPRLIPNYAERLAVRRAGPDDEAGMRACYEQARRLPANNGWLARTDWEWSNRLWKTEHERVVYRVGGAVEGYLVYTLTWTQDSVPARVVEWVWTSDAAWRGLAGFLAALGEQATGITYNAPQGNPLLAALNEPYDRLRPRVEFVFSAVAKLVSGFMLRVVHLPTALSARRYRPEAQAEFVLKVSDAQLPANCQPLLVRIEDSQAVVTAWPDDARHTSRPIPCTIETDMVTFSELYAGALSAVQARTAGRLRADDAGCAALLAAFSAAPLYMQQSDWF